MNNEYDLHYHRGVGRPLTHILRYLRLRRCEAVLLLYLQILLVSHNEGRPNVLAMVVQFATFPSVCIRLQVTHHPSQVVLLYKDLEAASLQLG